MIQQSSALAVPPPAADVICEQPLTTDKTDQTAIENIYGATCIFDTFIVIYVDKVKS